MGRFELSFLVRLVVCVALLMVFAMCGVAGTLLAASTLARSKGAETTLPMDCHFNIDQLSVLFEKPEHRVRRFRRRQLKSPVDHSGPDDRHSPDSDGGGDEVDFGGGMDDDFGDENVQQAEELVPEAEHERMEMVPEPEKVQKQNISYAKKATQVDIKALKKNVWEVLCETSSGTGATCLSSEVSFQSVVGQLDRKVRQLAWHGLRQRPFSQAACLLPMRQHCSPWSVCTGAGGQAQGCIARLLLPLPFVPRKREWAPAA